MGDITRAPDAPGGRNDIICNSGIRWISLSTSRRFTSTAPSNTPTSVLVEDGADLDYYIANAGGYTAWRMRGGSACGTSPARRESRREGSYFSAHFQTRRKCGVRARARSRGPVRREGVDRGLGWDSRFHHNGACSVDTVMRTCRPSCSVRPADKLWVVVADRSGRGVTRNQYGQAARSPARSGAWDRCRWRAPPDSVGRSRSPCRSVSHRRGCR